MAGKSFGTVIDGGKPTNPDFGSVVTFNTNEGMGAVLDGFSITNGKGTFIEQSPGLFVHLGGGILCQSSSPLLRNNIFTSNKAFFGGGFYCNDASPVLANNIITGNKAFFGAGICCEFFSSPIITNNTITENSSSLFISYCDLKGGMASVHVDPNCAISWGRGMIDSDPLFIDPVNGDFHLTHTSPCKDTGDNNAVKALTDFENDPRIAYGTVDMGADEFHTHLYYTGNTAPGGALNLNFIGAPATTPVFLWLGSGILNTPMSLPPHGEWFLKFPILMQAPLGSIPGPSGVLSLSGVVPNLPPPLDLPFQAGIGNKLTNLCVVEIR